MAYQLRALCPCGWSHKVNSWTKELGTKQVPACPKCGKCWAERTVKSVKRPWYRF